MKEKWLSICLCICCDILSYLTLCKRISSFPFPGLSSCSLLTHYFEINLAGKTCCRSFCLTSWLHTPATSCICCCCSCHWSCLCWFPFSLAGGKCLAQLFFAVFFLIFFFFFLIKYFGTLSPISHWILFTRWWPHFGGKTRSLGSSF